MGRVVTLKQLIVVRRRLKQATERSISSTGGTSTTLRVPEPWAMSWWLA
jgi:hypothetical protein